MCGGGDVFQSIGNAFASIDPGPAIGSALADVDKAVNDVVPGGWATLGVAALTAGAGAALAGGEALAAGIAEGAVAAEGTAAATGGLMEGALAEDVFAGLAGTSGDLGALANASDAALLASEAAPYAGDAAYELQGLENAYEGAQAANPFEGQPFTPEELQAQYEAQDLAEGYESQYRPDYEPSLSDANRLRQGYNLANQALGGGAPSRSRLPKSAGSQMPVGGSTAEGAAGDTPAGVAGGSPLLAALALRNQNQGPSTPDIEYNPFNAFSFGG